VVIPGDLQGTQGCPIGDGDMRSGEMIAPSRGTGPGGYRGDQETRRGVKVDSGRKKIIECAEYNGIHTTSNENAHIVETNVQRWATAPDGHLGNGIELGSVGSD